MFIIPAIQQSAMGADDDSLLGTMHLNALNGSGDVLGSSSLSSGSMGGCFRGPMMPGSTSSPTTTAPALSTPSYSGRGQRRGEVFGGLFGACVSDNHPYRPHDSGTASLFQEDPTKTATAAAVVNAGLATAGTTQLYAPPHGIASPREDSAGNSYRGEPARKNGEKSSRSKKSTHKLHHQKRLDSNPTLVHSNSHQDDIGYSSKNSGSLEGYKTRHDSQLYNLAELSRVSPSFLNDLCYEANVEERFRESQMLLLAKDSDRKRRGKGKHPRRHSLDLDLALDSQPSASHSSRKDGRIKSACPRGRNSIPSELELALHSARSGYRNRGEGDQEGDLEDLTLSVSEVKISTDTISESPSRLGRKDPDVIGHDSRSAHAHKKHRRAYTTDSSTSARAMKLLEKCKEKKANSHDHGHSRSSKHQQKQEMQYSNKFDEDSDYSHQHPVSKSGQHSASSRSSSGARHLIARHLSDNVTQASNAGPPGDVDAKGGKSRGKLLSRFSLE